MDKGDAPNSLEDTSEKYALWERDLPSAEELVPLNQSLVTPILACAFSIKDVSFRERTPADVEKAAQATINSIYESARVGSNTELNNEYQQPHYPSVTSPQSRGHFGSGVANSSLSNRFGISRERLNSSLPFNPTPNSNALPSASQGLGYGHENYSQSKFAGEATHYGPEGRFGNEPRFGHPGSSLADGHLKDAASPIQELRTNHFLKNESRVFPAESRVLSQSRHPAEVLPLDPSARAMEPSDTRNGHHDSRNSETEQRLLLTDSSKQADLHLDVRGPVHAESSRLGPEIHPHSEEGRGNSDMGYGSNDGTPGSMNSDRGRQTFPLFERSRVTPDVGQSSESAKLNSMGLSNRTTSASKKSRKSSDGDEDGEESGETSADDHLPRTLKRPRLVWTPQLHKRFVDAVGHLGIKNAVPKTIMQLMNVEGLTRENVASHLQKYRLYLKRMQGVPGDSHSPNDQLFASASLPNLAPASHQLYLPNRHDDMASYPTAVAIPNHMHGMNHDPHAISAQHATYNPSYEHHVFNRQLIARSPTRDTREYLMDGNHTSVPASPPQRVLSLFPSAS